MAGHLFRKANYFVATIFPLSLMLLILGLSGCDNGCKSSSPTNAGTHQPAYSEHIPQNAQAVVFAASFDELLKAAAAGQKYLPGQTVIAPPHEGGIRFLSEDLMSSESWRALGWATERPATVFYAEKRLVLIAELHDTKAFQAELTSLGQRSDYTFRREKSQGFSLIHVMSHDEKPLAHIAWLDKKALILLEPAVLGSQLAQESASEHTRGRDLLLKTLKIEPEQRWKGVARQNELMQQQSTRVTFHGAIEPAGWLLQKQTAGQARVLLERLAHQTGRVHFLANYEPETHKLKIHLRTHGSPGEPVMVPDLGEPTGDLPTVRGLIKPGVLGVVRLSGAPDQFFNVIRSALPADQRLALDKLFSDLDAELKIDVENDLIKNLKGHAIVVMYGIENRIFTADNFRLADVFQLRATREAVLLPIQNRESMERVLNVMTQLSRGNLRRQAIGDSIQYAWLPDGALEWALILNNDYLVVVDSAAAVDHALAYERSAQAPGAMLSDLGVEAIFEKSSRSGFYIDVVALSNILAESGHPIVAAWLRPFQAVVLTTDDVNQVGHTNIELTLSSDELQAAHESD